MPTQIKFGTSGWRAIVADEFTVANIRRAITGIARYVASQKPEGAKVVVGRDPRFLGENFVALAADILSAHGITPLVIGDAAPTPAIAYEVIRVHADGAINFTASHNPPEYNGIKFSTPDGAPALPEVTHKVEDVHPGIRRRFQRRAIWRGRDWENSSQRTRPGRRVPAGLGWCRQPAQAAAHRGARGIPEAAEGTH